MNNIDVNTSLSTEIHSFKLFKPYFDKIITVSHSYKTREHTYSITIAIKIY